MIPPILCTGWPPRVPPICAGCGAPCLWEAETVTDELKTFVWVCPEPNCPTKAEAPAA